MIETSTNLLSQPHPVLYSYRRCPYAMRARMGIWASGLEVEQREIVFWDKPNEMLQASPKGTVPVLILENGQVIDESLDILLYALHQNDPYQWLPSKEPERSLADSLVALNDQFKPFLDHYKYADRHPEKTQYEHREDGCFFLNHLESALTKNLYLLNNRVSFADIAIFPFVRQFANVDKNWWSTRPYVKVDQWLTALVESDAFAAVMKNRPTWEPKHHPLWVNEPELTTKDTFRDASQFRSHPSTNKEFGDN